MTTMTLNLANGDINQAIQQWAAAQGCAPQGNASIHYTEGDRPGESGSFSAEIEVAPLAPATPATRRKLGTNGG